MHLPILMRLPPFFFSFCGKMALVFLNTSATSQENGGRIRGRRPSHPIPLPSLSPPPDPYISCLVHVSWLFPCTFCHEIHSMRCDSASFIPHRGPSPQVATGKGGSHAPTRDYFLPLSFLEQMRIHGKSLYCICETNIDGSYLEQAKWP